LIREWELAMPRDLFGELEAFLFADRSQENGCYLLAYSYQRKKRAVLVATAMVRPAEDSWSDRAANALEPSSSFVNDAVVRADLSGAGLVFVHTHPSLLHPVAFSGIDERTNRRLLPNLAEILPGRPLGSVVIGPGGFAGVVYDDGKIHRLRFVRISGLLWERIRAHDNESDIPDRSHSDLTFDRQRRVLGTSRDRDLRGLTVTVVGVGGTGSSVAIQLARMGISRLRLVDRDILEGTNLSRVYGSGPADIAQPKVAVLKRHIASFSKTKVEVVQGDIAADEVRFELAESDVIFGCTDNLTSRAILNEISVRYCIPLIDVGCRIRGNQAETIDYAIAKVQVVAPDTACLWCTGTLDGRIILQEALPAAERQKLEAEGYYENVERQPSVISLTTLAASLAVNKLLCLLGAFGPGYASRTQLELRDGILNEDTPEIRRDCVCRKYRGLAEGGRTGDVPPFAT